MSALPFGNSVQQVLMVHSLYLTDTLIDAEIPSLIFLTKVDKYDPDVIGVDLSKTFHSSRLLQLIEASAMFEVCNALVEICASALYNFSFHVQRHKAS